MRKALFAHIPHRDHRLVKIYTAGSDQNNLMAHGKVDYKHHHGHTTATDFAGRYVLEKVGDEIKFKVVQIILVCSPRDNPRD